MMKYLILQMRLICCIGACVIVACALTTIIHAIFVATMMYCKKAKLLKQRSLFIVFHICFTATIAITS